MGDDWLRAIVGGLLGGGLASAVAWYKLRDEQLSRRRALLLDVYTAADGVLHPIVFVRQAEAIDRMNEFGRARAAFLLVETDPEILTKLTALQDAVYEMVTLSGSFEHLGDIDQRVQKPIGNLKRCLRELLETARRSYRTAGG